MRQSEGAIGEGRRSLFGLRTRALEYVEADAQRHGRLTGVPAALSTAHLGVFLPRYRKSLFLGADIEGGAQAHRELGAICREFRPARSRAPRPRVVLDISEPPQEDPQTVRALWAGRSAMPDGAGTRNGPSADAVQRPGRKQVFHDVISPLD
jgi:hypothetical protein